MALSFQHILAEDVGGIFGGAFGNCRSLADSKIGIVKNYYAEERWKKSTAAGMKKQEDNR